MKNSFESFGLGSLTGVDLPGEVSGYSSKANLSDIFETIQLVSLPRIRRFNLHNMFRQLQMTGIV